MAIAIDASSPAIKTGTGSGTLTTASFTPASGSLIVAIAIGGGNFSNATTTSTITDSGGGSWTTAGSQVGSTGQRGIVKIAWSTAGASPAARTVSAAYTNNANGRHLAVFVITGASVTGVGGIGLGVDVDTFDTSSLSCAITTQNAASIVLGGYLANRNSGSDTLSAGTGNTLTTGLSGTNPYDNGTDGVASCFTKSTSVPGTPGATSYAVNHVNNNGGPIVLVEILPGGPSNIAAADVSQPASDTAHVTAAINAADTSNAAADTASISVALQVNEAPLTTEAATVRILAIGETGTGEEGTKVVANGSILAFGSDNIGATEAAAILVVSADAATTGEVSFVGYQGALPPGPRIVRILPNS